MILIKYLTDLSGKALTQENGGWNVVLADGSEKWIEPDKVYKMVSMSLKDHQGTPHVNIVFYSLELKIQYLFSFLITNILYFSQMLCLYAIIRLKNFFSKSDTNHFV